MAAVSLPRCSTSCTEAVLQTEASFMAFSDFFPRIWVDEIIMDECLERVKVVVTRMPNPFTSVQYWYKVCRAKIHRLTGES